MRDAEIHAVEADHHSVGEVDGQYLTGVPLCFIVSADTGDGVYFLADRLIFGDLELFGQLYKRDLALIGV